MEHQIESSNVNAAAYSALLSRDNSAATKTYNKNNNNNNKAAIHQHYFHASSYSSDSNSAIVYSQNHAHGNEHIGDTIQQHPCFVSDTYNNNNNNNNNNNRKSNTRSTYGAYTNNTLPRGPYLQYKYGDRPTPSTKATTSPPSSSSSTMPLTKAVAAGAAVTTAAMTMVAPVVANHSNRSGNSKTIEYIDNNTIKQMQQKRHIEQLKNEFIHLPRAKIYSGHSGSGGGGIGERDSVTVDAMKLLPSGSGKSSNHHLLQRSRTYFGAEAGDTATIDNFGMIQTLGRYKHLPKRSEIIAASPPNAIDNFEYFASDNMNAAYPTNRYPDYFNQRTEFRPYENLVNKYPTNPSSMVKSKSLGNCVEYFQNTLTVANAKSSGSKYGMHVDEDAPVIVERKSMAIKVNETRKAHTLARSQLHKSGANYGNTMPMTTTLNFVTLADVVKYTPRGLSQMEGWALLCQSVQALQDLFLSDMPSTSRILPLVHPSNLQITSRGRVIFNILPAGQMESLNDVTSYISFLSPEYLNGVGKLCAFVESDIEKMWIYSLGITLRRTLQSFSSANNQRKATHALSRGSGGGVGDGATLLNAQNDIGNTNQRTKAPGAMMVRCQLSTAPSRHPTGNDDNRDSDSNNGAQIAPKNSSKKSSLDYVIRTMCAPNRNNRASLMYLLDAISQYCRYYHQSKPFSHITIDLFKETVEKIYSKKLYTNDEYVPPPPISKDEHRSDTDSGHSSIHGDREFVDKPNEQIISRQPSKLKVARGTAENQQLDQYVEHKNVNVIGHSEPSDAEMEKKPAGAALQVIRRKDAILRRRNMQRRNTIDVNCSDMLKATANGHFEYGFGAAKSTNCLDKVGAKDSYEFGAVLNGTSMPDLSKANKFHTLPNLRVRRGSRIVIGSSDDGSLKNISVQSKGPEFILNSSLPCQEIDITDAKCQHRRAVNVLLLNGRSMNITCESTTTTVLQVLEAVVKAENFVENFFLGLCALLGGDLVFLPHDLKIYKVAPQIWGSLSKRPNYGENVIFTLFLRIKFFLPNLRGISSLESRHLLYLQLRKSILESQILCTDDDLISLGGLALQAEIGDFKQSMKSNEYFTISHYLPEGVYQRNKEMAKYLRNSHFCKRGLHAKEAEHQFLQYVQEMKEYGLHLYSATWNVESNATHDVYVAISLNGIAIFERCSRINADNQLECGTNSRNKFQRKLYANFDWLEIDNLCFSKHSLCVVVRKSESLKAKDNNKVKYKFKMDGRKSYFAFNLASQHHKFYMQLRDSYISIKHISNELNIPLTRGGPALASEIFPSDYEAPADKESSPKSAIDDKNIKIIDKQTRSTGLRVRNLKKSMLNDNKLIKLRNKLLKRSKSTVGISSGDPNRAADMSDGCSKEENQNKENELPKTSSINSLSCLLAQQQQLQQDQQQQLSPSKLVSPNRNRVKMGTRVFSSHFLNKSFDNIYDTAIDIYQFDDDLLDGRQTQNGASSTVQPSESGKSDISPNSEARHSQNTTIDGLSLKSGSLSSLYYSEKMSEHFSGSPLPSEAYIIHSSIRSTSNENFAFSLQNETVSETLLDKFDNLTVNSSTSDRILTRVTIPKDYVGDRKAKHAANEASNGSKPNENGLTLGISIVQGSDNKVYVKDLVENGPGARHGIRIGDQILAVDGVTLLNMSYDSALKLLQNTGATVELVLSQIFHQNTPHSGQQETSMKQREDSRTTNSSQEKNDVPRKERETYQTSNQCQIKPKKMSEDAKNRNERMTTVKSVPDLPKVVAILHKHEVQAPFGAKPSSQSRKYTGPHKYPVTPIRTAIIGENQRLSLLADDDEQQVYI